MTEEEESFVRGGGLNRDRPKFIQAYRQLLERYYSKLERKTVLYRRPTILLPTVGLL